MAKKVTRGASSGRVEQMVGPLEAACLRALWRGSPATVSQVREQLNTRHDPPLAYTTVMTVLSRLHDKGHVTRERRGRGYAYSPAFTEEELVDVLSRREVDRLIDRFGDVALARFAETLGRVDPETLRKATKLAGERADD